MNEGFGILLMRLSDLQHMGLLKHLPRNYYPSIPMPPSKLGMLAPAAFTSRDAGCTVLLIIFEFYLYSVEQFIFKAFMAGKY